MLFIYMRLELHWLNLHIFCVSLFFSFYFLFQKELQQIMHVLLVNAASRTKTVDFIARILKENSNRRQMHVYLHLHFFLLYLK